MAAATGLRFALGGLGAAVLGYGVVGLLTEPAIRDPEGVGEWLVVGLLVHDAVLAPLVFAACALAYRIIGARGRGRLAALLLTGGSLVLISIPALVRHGRNANPTVLPLDYARNLGVLLAVLLGVSVLYSVADAVRRRRALKAAAAAVARIAAAAEAGAAARSEEARKARKPDEPQKSERSEEPGPEPGQSDQLQDSEQSDELPQSEQSEEPQQAPEVEEQ